MEVQVAGVYISYPFCAQKCTYCNFASGVHSKDVERNYVERLCTEIAAFRFEEPADTVFLGGGTPSAMELDALARVLRSLPNRNWREATIEAAPGALTAEIARAWRELGINRVSFGVQSFVTGELRRAGRRHTAETVEREAAILREAGIANFNIDLIAGLAGQTASSWRESLDWIERIAPPHVSVYMLEVDEDSRLGAEILLGGKRYGAGDVPSDEAIAAMYETAVERLAAMGIERYEISNFARPEFESAHNMKYWELAPYYGFGVDAHSFDGARRWQNPDSVEAYLQGGGAVHERAQADERLWVGLRLMRGVTVNDDDATRYGEAIRRFEDAGLLAHNDGRLRLTPRGVMLSNEVFQEFLQV